MLLHVTCARIDYFQYVLRNLQAVLVFSNHDIFLRYDFSLVYLIILHRNMLWSTVLEAYFGSDYYFLSLFFLLAKVLFHSFRPCSFRVLKHF